MPTVLVIIVTWNRCADVMRLLSSLSQIEYSRGAYDVLVVDNASSDGTVAAIASQFPAVRIISNRENTGGSGGFNVGLQWAFEQPPGTYDYLWLLDDDVLVHRQALAELIRVLVADPSIGIVGSTMLKLEKPWTVREMGCYFDTASAKTTFFRAGNEIAEFKNKDLAALTDMDPRRCHALEPADDLLNVNYVAAASLLVRCDQAIENGFFRNYFIHLDDVEWCLRMARRGYRAAVAPLSLIWHLSSSSSRTIPPLIYYYNNRNVLDLIRDYGKSNASLIRLKLKIWAKAFYYVLRGKMETSYYHRKAIHDFDHQLMGKCKSDPPDRRSVFYYGWPRLKDIRTILR